MVTCEVNQMNSGDLWLRRDVDIACLLVL